MGNGHEFKILAVFGTRPEAIKMCPLVKELRSNPLFDTKVCVTGQHREMLEQVLKAFNVVPDFDLDIMRPNQDLFDITCSCLQKIKAVFGSFRPDLVLVHGDTTTAFATALACFYSGIKVGHVEAGLRTYDLLSPYPEEFNRQSIDKICDLYFSPTEQSRQNLLNEHVEKGKIFVTGNTAIDALKTTVTSDYRNPVLEWSKGSHLVLVTAHRRENIGSPMISMFCAIKRIADDPDNNVKVVYPVHFNPAVRDLAKEILGDDPRIRLVEPLDVLDFHNLMAHSYLILTDSGGIQEEAPSLGKPVLVMRDTTERPEGIAAGTLKLVGTDEEKIVTETTKLLKNAEEYQKMTNVSNPYGDGHACEKIIAAIVKYYGISEER